MVAALLQGLSESGFVEGRNVAIEYRWAENQTDRLPAMAADLVRRGVDVIAPAGGPASVRKLLPALKSFAEVKPPTLLFNATTMSLEDVLASLNAPSAKIWPRERHDHGECLFSDHALEVARWHKSDPNGMWRKTPIGADLEIKGALLGLDGTEYVPEGKRTRSCQIHCMGFT